MRDEVKPEPMPLDFGSAMNLFVAASLALLSTTLLLASRRRSDHLVLALFLFIVSLNFLAAALHRLTSEVVWDRVNAVTNALDSFFLLLFVTSFPYLRRTRVTRALLGLVGLAAILAVGIAVLRFDLIRGGTPTLAQSPGRHLLLGQLAIAYSAAWLLSLRAWADAPTLLLAKRAAWMVTAVGVAVIPRVALLPVDYGWEPLSLFASLPHETLGLKAASILLDTGLAVLIMALLFAAGPRIWRRVPEPNASTLRGPLWFVGLVIAAFGAFRLIYEIGNRAGMGLESGYGVFYALRWVLFAAILVYGILAHELVEFRRASERVVPVLGGILGAFLAFLATSVWMLRQGVEESIGFTLALAMGLGSLLPAAFLSRTAIRPLTRWRALDEGTERRLELYRAAVEAAWASGPPNEHARRRLEQDRRTFGVSTEEARTLEHAHASQARTGAVGLRPGDEPIPGLVLGEVLGEGAHGRVFLARRHLTGDRVVVKEFHRDRLGARETRRRLLGEWRAVQALDHPNVVRLLEVSIVAGHHLLVMEYVDGRALSESLTSGPIPPAQARRVLQDVLLGLEAAHKRGIIHRDLKPANVLVGRDGAARVTDFGVAASPSDAEAIRTTITTMKDMDVFTGTLPYMAPEQVTGGAVGPWTDLYAVGLLAYEALVGRPAVDVRGCNPLEAMERVAQPRVDVERVPAPWRTLVERALDVEPKRRFRDAKEMREALPGA